jgi:hypothetical protein
LGEARIAKIKRRRPISDVVQSVSGLFA